MQTVDDLIDLAVREDTSVSAILRKCLVLAYELKNATLKEWTEHELNGYEEGEGDLVPVPDYRKIRVTAKGIWHGGWGAKIENRPIPSACLNANHRHWAETATLMQPIGSYENISSTASVDWPTNLVAFYQTKIIKGFALVAAWQEVPSSAFVGILAIVRNKILKFALEIKEELSLAGDRPSAVPPEKVQAAVVNYIFGGTNVISGIAKEFTQVGSIVVQEGNFDSLATAMKSLDIEDTAIASLKQAVESDANEGKGFGSKTKDWILTIGKKAGNAGIDGAQQIATQWLLQYFGLN